MKAQIVQTREMICDAMVMERLVDTRVYRQSLLRLAERIMAGRSINLTAVGMFDGNLLKERIMRMKTKQSIPGRVARAGLVGIATLSLLAAATIGTSFARTVDAQTANSPAPWGAVFKAGKDVTPPRIIFAVDPEYPKSMKASAKATVICVVGIIVDRNGMPQNVHIVQSAEKDFDTNAAEAVKQYRFKPALRMGKPVAVVVDIQVNFRKY